MFLAIEFWKLIINFMSHRPLWGVFTVDPITMRSKSVSKLLNSGPAQGTAFVGAVETSWARRVSPWTISGKCRAGWDRASHRFPAPSGHGAPTVARHLPHWAT